MNQQIALQHVNGAGLMPAGNMNMMMKTLPEVVFDIKPPTDHETVQPAEYQFATSHKLLNPSAASRRGNETGGDRSLDRIGQPEPPERVHYIPNFLPQLKYRA